jgi:hypothetical protein
MRGCTSAPSRCSDGGPGNLTVLVHATTPSGSQQLTLTRTADDRWSGRGESSFPWGPQGAIELVRTTRIQ